MSQVYANRPQSTDALKINIIQAIPQIQPHLCSRLIEKWTTRIRTIVRNHDLSKEGKHKPSICTDWKIDIKRLSRRLFEGAIEAAMEKLQ
ncbi:hypothetical protein J6590_078163 [Homalodisca vitripennis]|nr:hypothetical protein J6590_078163 [Homalodisca vitripennis]